MMLVHRVPGERTKMLTQVEAALTEAAAFIYARRQQDWAIES